MKRLSTRILLGVTIAILGALFADSPVVQAQTNLLGNPGFDEPYNSRTGVANTWSPWHEERNVDVNCDSESMYRKPSWGAEVVGGNNGQLFFDGNRSQHVGNQFATWHAGVFQTLNVTNGETYQFSVNTWGRASNEQYPAASDRSVDFTVRVGIDPNGSGVWFDSDVVWGPAVSPHEVWQQVSAQATATGDQISIYIAANFAGPGHCRKHLDAWFDAASLVSTAPPATNTPVATNTPAATNTPNRPTATPLPTGVWPTATPNPAWTPTTVWVPPTNTPAPVNNGGGSSSGGGSNSGGGSSSGSGFVQPAATAVPTNTPVPVATDPPPPTDTPAPTNTPAPTGGTICVNTFSDENANGLRDPLEGYMAGIPLFIGQGGVVMNQSVSTGSEAPVCFEALDPGEYEVAQRLPGGLEMTTAGNLAIEVKEGQTIGLEFGSRFRQDAGGDSGEAATNGGGTAVADNTNTSGDSSADNGANNNAVADAASDGPLGNLDTLTLAGIVVLGLAVALLAGILFALLRR